MNFVRDTMSKPASTYTRIHAQLTLAHSVSQQIATEWRRYINYDSIRYDTIRLDKNRHIFSHSIRLDSPDVIHHVSMREFFFSFSILHYSCKLYNKQSTHCLKLNSRSCYCCGCCFYFLLAHSLSFIAYNICIHALHIIIDKCLCRWVLKMTPNVYI